MFCGVVFLDLLTIDPWSTCSVVLVMVFATTCSEHRSFTFFEAITRFFITLYLCQFPYSGGSALVVSDLKFLHAMCLLCLQGTTRL
jgi:hypothetical protein